MFKKKSVRPVLVPCIKRCCDCGDRKVAIAFQAVVHRSTGEVHFWWYCQECAKWQGIKPSLDLLSKLKQMERKSTCNIHTHELTLQEYLSTKPKVTRLFHHYTHHERVARAGSHRLGHRERDAVGHYIYTIAQRPGVCFRSPSDARRAAHRKAVELALEQRLQVPQKVLRDYPWLQMEQVYQEELA
ncbi:MAG: hypothetical protein HC851_20470 [Acaryochloris sp. RU_4_1]|nr:hypothetical protein [Acaryochloris sp. RU_4_1]NJR56754.1 hypothetical protein [Acaryochloris sp. CRU_2_0]